MSNSPSDKILLQVQDISYTINGNTLINKVSFSIERNQVISIIGYNGSGKSTLLKLLLGSITPNSGTITKNPGVHVGYVPQKLSMMHQLPLTVKDFLKIYNTAISQDAGVGCQFLDIDEILERPMSGLSGGQLQKVLIYNALLGSPQILLLDEPTAGLDVVAQKEFYSLIDHIHQQHGITIVLVSHDIHTVYSKSDTVICLHQGICCTGCPSDEGFSKEVTTLFGGYVMPYLHTHAHDHDR